MSATTAFHILKLIDDFGNQIAFCCLHEEAKTQRHHFFREGCE